MSKTAKLSECMCEHVELYLIWVVMQLSYLLMARCFDFLDLQNYSNTLSHVIYNSAVYTYHFQKPHFLLTFQRMTHTTRTEGAL